MLQAIEPGLVCDVAYPADEGANLPDRAGLLSYDAVVLSGSVAEVPADLLDLLKADAEATAALSPAELDSLFDLEHHLRHVDTIFARVFG